MTGAQLRMSRRVMNLAHIVTQNGRRLGDRIGFVCGDRSWTWRELDAMVSALAAALAEQGMTPIGNTRDAATTFIAGEKARWDQVIAKARLTAQ